MRLTHTGIRLFVLSYKPGSFELFSFAPFHFLRFFFRFQSTLVHFSSKNTSFLLFVIMSRQRSTSRGQSNTNSSRNTANMDLCPIDDHFSLKWWLPILAHGKDTSILFRLEEHISHRAQNSEVNLQNLHFFIFRFLLI